MKHLKKFNESNTLDVIKDICIELEDLEFKMSYQKNPEFGNSITIFGYYEGSNSVYDRDMRMIVKGTNFNSIKDCILRLKDYLGDNLIEISYNFTITIPNLTEETEIDDPIRRIVIVYK